MREILYNDDYAFYLIPKCASSSLRETLPKYGYKNIADESMLNGQRKIAVIRDVFERFISAFITVERIENKHIVKEDLLGNLVLTLLKFYKGLNQDYHYTPQSNFITSDCELIKIENISSKLLDIGGIDLPVLNKSLFIDEIEQVRGYLKRHWELTGIINKYYERDIELCLQCDNI